MKIVKAQLKQIILEEVQIYLTEYYIEKEILFEDSEDPEVQKDREEYRRLTRQGRKIPAALALALGLGAGGLKHATDQHSDIKADISKAAQQANVERNSTVDSSVEDLNKLAGNFPGWMWKTDETQSLPFPTNPDNHSEAVLPPEWSVIARVALDKKNGTPAYSVDQNYLKTADSHRALAAAYQNIKGADVQGSATQFFDTFKPEDHPFMDASEMGAHSFRSGNPGIPSAMLDIDGDGAPDNQNLVYIPFDELPDDYVMPVSGMTKEEMYKKYYYGYGMSLEEFSELKANIAPDTEISPELIKKTKEQADSLSLPKDSFPWKESKNTWKNYKNRKKVLA
tara:strand:+ start:748 stop:1764 length:1017 start_codon:yes stop_codon:yes gene_type:complete